METIIGIILLMALLSLPDLLRKKRKYPTRGHSRPGQKPPQTTGRPQTPPAQAPYETEPEEEGPWPWQRRTPEPEPESVPERRRTSSSQPAYTQAQLQAAAALPSSQHDAGPETVVPQRVQPACWSGLEGPARDIYAGLVWSELLQKPVSMRPKER